MFLQKKIIKKGNFKALVQIRSKKNETFFYFQALRIPCSLYIHTHLPILGVGKRFEQWLKLTIANIVTELSANNTIC